MEVGDAAKVKQGRKEMIGSLETFVSGVKMVVVRTPAKRSFGRKGRGNKSLILEHEVERCVESIRNDWKLVERT